MTSNKKLVVFTDGSCTGNGKSYAKGGVGIHFPNGELEDISKVFTKDPITNQRTELYAIYYALVYIKKELEIKNLKILIKTDSEYSINCLTKWYKGWENNNWKTKNDTDVCNKEIIQRILKYIKKYNITFEHVLAHTNKTDFNSLANQQADLLATSATKNTNSKEKDKIELIDDKPLNKVKKQKNDSITIELID